jgi:hypothetical protein
MENTMQTIPEVNERRTGPPASPFATPDVIGRFLSRYWGVELAIGVFSAQMPTKISSVYATKGVTDIVRAFQIRSLR